MSVLNMDAVVETLTAGLINVGKFPRLLDTVGMVPEYSVWKPGEKLRILLVGYNGARNTGADVRVEAMVRQFYNVFGKDNVHIGVMSLDKQHSLNYYKDPTEIIEMDTVFFKDILQSVSRYHMAVLSEGSCFKSKFANALTTFFVAGAGLMRSQGKPCIAYGSEAGKMDWLLQSFVKKYCNDVYVISRTQPSMDIATSLGLDGELGTDTAWPFEPASEECSRKILEAHGWDGNKPVVGFAVINPFWWPVRPNLTKFLGLKLGLVSHDNHYDKYYFFSSSEERTRKFNAYRDAFAKAIDAFTEKHNVFPVLIGMERLDYSACTFVQEKLHHKAPIFCSTDYNGYKMCSILHKLDLLATSRYHARVLSMTGAVASCGVSMDERLENLLRETGHLDDYYLKVDDPDLMNKLPDMLDRLWENREKVGQENLKMIPGYLRKMADMGHSMKKFTLKSYPELELPPEPADWTGYLPEMNPWIEKLLSK